MSDLGDERAVFELAIIILNYRTAALSAACLDSLQPQIRPGMIAIVVDNDSRDDSATQLEQHIEERGYRAWARVVRSPRNVGFAAGNNVGIAAVQAQAYVLLNSDTWLHPEALAELSAALASDPSIGLVGPRFEDAQGNPLASCFHTVPGPIGELARAARTGAVARLLWRYERPPFWTDMPCAPAWMPFACVLIRRSLLDAIGPLDEGYFMYFEDVDYCLRARAAGFRLLHWPRARVIHLVGQSSQVTSEQRAYARAPRYFYAARARHFRKHFGRTGLVQANLAWLAGRAVSAARELVQRGRQSVREGELWDIWTTAA